MLNDLKEWATGKGEDARELATGVVEEVQTKDVMDWSGSLKPSSPIFRHSSWSGTAWLVLVGVAIVALIGILG